MPPKKEIIKKSKSGETVQGTTQKESNEEIVKKVDTPKKKRNVTAEKTKKEEKENENQEDLTKKISLVVLQPEEEKKIFKLLISGSEIGTNAEKITERIESCIQKAGMEKSKQFFICRKWTVANTKERFLQIDARLAKAGMDKMDSKFFAVAAKNTEKHRQENAKTEMWELPGLYPVYRIAKGLESGHHNLTSMHAGCLVVIPRPAFDGRATKRVGPGQSTPSEGYYFEPLEIKAEGWKEGKLPKDLPPLFKEFGLTNINVIRGQQKNCDISCTDMTVDFIYTILQNGVPSWKDAAESYAL